METTTNPIIAIRLAGEDDVQVVRRLAALDSRPVPKGPVLLAVVDGEPRAAMSVNSGAAVADPFHLTAELTDLLGIRAARLRGEDAVAGGARRSFLERRRHAFVARP